MGYLVKCDGEEFEGIYWNDPDGGNVRIVREAPCQ
jgi:hypothetical protein